MYLSWRCGGVFLPTELCIGQWGLACPVTFCYYTDGKLQSIESKRRMYDELDIGRVAWCR